MLGEAYPRVDLSRSHTEPRATRKRAGLRGTEVREIRHGEGRRPLFLSQIEEGVTLKIEGKAVI